MLSVVQIEQAIRYIVLIDEYKEKLAYYTKQHDSYIKRHGNDGCPYLQHRINMVNYYRGACDAIESVEKILNSIREAK